MAALSETKVKDINVYEQYTEIEFTKAVKLSTIYDGVEIFSGNRKVYFTAVAVDGVSEGNSETIATKFRLAYSDNYSASTKNSYVIKVSEKVKNYSNAPVTETVKTLNGKIGGVKLNLSSNVNVSLGEEYDLNYYVSNAIGEDISVRFQKDYTSTCFAVENSMAYDKESCRGKIKVYTTGQIGTGYITVTIPEYGISRTIIINVTMPNENSEIFVKNIVENSTNKTIDFDFYNNTVSAQTFVGLCAIYNSNGALIDVKKIDINKLQPQTTEHINVQFNTGGWSSYKIFAWQSMETLKPLRDVK